MQSGTKRKRKTFPKWKEDLLFIELLLMIGLFFVIGYFYYHPVQFEITSESSFYTCTIHHEGTYCCDPYESFKVKKNNWNYEIEITRCYKYVAFDSNHTW
jgi:hypothetical protein